ncbi:MAG: phage DNA encapsidation protein [Clostridia bacterium]|nr:phage DNA encapsidation protein [Clostridia bacterium]
MRKKKKEDDQDVIETVELSPYYDYTSILKQKATYNLIIGQRSNGKTFGWCRLVLDQYLNGGLPSAYLRRRDEMIKPTNIEHLFDPHLDYIEKYSDHKWNGVVYRNRGFFLCRYEETQTGSRVKVDQDPNFFCRCYAISTAETTKGQDVGELWSIAFDEFVTRDFYLANEFILFQNLLSSLIRDRDGTIIFMLANTVSKFCPYFREMGITKIHSMQQGTIDVYQIGQTKTKIAVEYCATAGNSKKVSKYFAFDNPELRMISTGAWEIALYRHAPEQLSEAQLIFIFFVIFDSQTIQGNIYMYKGYPIIFYHPKTTPIQDPEQCVIYREDTLDGNPLHQIQLRNCPTKPQQLIFDLIRQQKTFYADNECGEVVANWLKTQGAR